MNLGIDLPPLEYMSVQSIHHRTSRNIQVFTCYRGCFSGSEKNSSFCYITGWNQAAKRRATAKLSPGLLDADPSRLSLFANHPFNTLTLHRSRRDGIDSY